MEGASSMACRNYCSIVHAEPRTPAESPAAGYLIGCRRASATLWATLEQSATCSLGWHHPGGNGHTNHGEK